MKGPVPSQEPINPNQRDQFSIGLSWNRAWEAIGQKVAQRSYRPHAVGFVLGANPLALFSMLGCLSSVIPSVLKLCRVGSAFNPKRTILVDGGVAIKSIREFSQGDKGPTQEEKQLEGVWDSNGFPVLDQTLFYDVSVIPSEDCTRVDPEIRDALILPRSVSWDWGRIPEDSIEQGVCRPCRSPVQNLGSWGRTPVQRWNRHG